MRRLLAGAGLEISVGKMSVLWSATVAGVGETGTIFRCCARCWGSTRPGCSSWTRQPGGRHRQPGRPRPRTGPIRGPVASRLPGPGEQAWGRGLAPLPVNAHETITEVSHLLGHDAKLFGNHDGDVQLIDHDREHCGCRIELATPEGTLWDFCPETGNGA